MGSVVDNLQNIEPLTINETLINNTDNLLLNVISNANTATDNMWFVWAILALWVFLIYYFMKREDQIQLDLPRTLFVSSGWCLIVSIGAALFTLTTNIFPIFWFSSIFFLSGLMVYRRSELGR